MKKLISILLCGMLMLTMLAACAKTETSTDAAADTAPQTENAAEQSGDAAAAQTTIVWQSWDSYSKYEAAILAFEQAHPEIHVEYEQVSDYMTKIMTEATSDELPDLISCKSGYTPIFADAGILQALDVSALQADAEYDYADFWETTYDYCTYDGTYYALPIDGGGYAWVYNEQMFDKLGITVPENGFTWTQFREVCQTLVDHKDELGISYPTLINDYGFRTIYPWAIQNGAEYLNADNTACLLNSEQTLGAIEYLQTLIADGYMPPMEKLDEGTYPIVGMLNSGEIAMGRIALWETTALEDSANVTWQVMHSPCADNGKQAEILYINTIAISATSKNQEAAQTFIKYIRARKA